MLVGPFFLTISKRHFHSVSFIRIPMGIIFIAGIGTGNAMPMEAHLFANLAAHLNSALNPLFYFVFNPKMRKGYIELFRLCTGRVFEMDTPFNSEELNIMIHKRTKKNTDLNIKPPKITKTCV